MSLIERWQDDDGFIENYKFNEFLIGKILMNYKRISRHFPDNDVEVVKEINYLKEMIKDPDSVFYIIKNCKELHINYRDFL